MRLAQAERYARYEAARLHRVTGVYHYLPGPEGYRVGNPKYWPGENFVYLAVVHERRSGQDRRQA